MLTSIKSLYGMVCVVLVSAVWALYFGQSVFGMLLIFAPRGLHFLLSALLQVVLVVVVAWLVWPRIAHLSVGSVVNSSKATVAIFLLTLALIAFPGTFLIPFAYAALSGKSNAMMYAWYSLFGIPVFTVLSVIGLVLVFQCRLRTQRNDA